MNNFHDFQKIVLQSKWNSIFSNHNGSAWISFKPQLGLTVYPCYACRDMFVSKSTFQDHANRRALLIKYYCEGCNQKYTFFNRCTFLLHARSHFALNEGQIDLNRIEIYKLPLEMMGFSPHPSVEKLFDVEEDTIDENCYVNAQFYSPDSSEIGKHIITLRPNDLLFCPTEENCRFQLTLRQISKNIPLCRFVTTDDQLKLKQSFLQNMKVKEEPDDSIKSEPIEENYQMPVISKIESLNTYPRCPECKEPQRCSMRMHIKGKNIPLDEKLKCSLCNYVSSTKCSHSAHERIHASIPPFICPECGKIFESREYLMKHLDDECFHLAKQVRIRCPGKKCGKLFASTTTFSIHFSQHIYTWLQCTICKECFESITAFSEHAKIHSNLCFSDKVFKCLGCRSDSSIIYQDNLKQHLDSHTKDRNRYLYVFVCKFCRNYFRSTGTYAAHLLKCQKMQVMIKQGYSYSVDFCTQCHNRIIFYDNENFVACTKCRAINSYNLKINDTYWPYPAKRGTADIKYKICPMCGVQCLKNNEAKHQLNCTYRNTKLFRNMFSNLAVSTDSSFGNEEFSGKKSSSETEVEGAKTSSFSMESLRKKRKKGALKFRTKKIILSSTPDESYLQGDRVRPLDGKYYCKMCDFQEYQRDKFQIHIVNHRHISTDYQCMECGECFVVKPSLIKHLKHYHKIEDTVSYFVENNCYDENAVQELKEIVKCEPEDYMEPIKANQCRVCLQEFSEDHELIEHSRIHGMVFLNGKYF